MLTYFSKVHHYNRWQRYQWTLVITCVFRFLTCCYVTQDHVKRFTKIQKTQKIECVARVKKSEKLGFFHKITTYNYETNVSQKNLYVGNQTLKTDYSIMDLLHICLGSCLWLILTTQYKCHLESSESLCFAQKSHHF